MSATGSLLIVVLLGADPAGLTLADVPPVDRRAADFYGAIAAGRENVAAAWTVDPGTVPLGGDTTLTLTVANAANPAELARPDLTWDGSAFDDFQVEDLPDAPPVDGVARFHYRLRPRKPGTLAIPPLKYRFYRPGYPEGRRLQATYANPVAVTVTPPAVAPTPAAVPVGGPESFFAVVPAGPPTVVPRLAWLVPLSLVPVMIAAGTVVGRRLFPDAARRSAVLRNRAARAALARLSRAGRTADPAAEVVAAVRAYLVARHRLPPTARTPTEVAAGLGELGWPVESVREVESLLAACDAARFSQSGDTGVSPTTLAADRVVGWEGGVP